MADHYRGLIKSLMKLGFLFKRQGERKHEIWRNRSTDQHVTFDRDEVARSRAAVAAVLKEASLPVEKPATGRAARSSRSGGRSGRTVAGRSRAKGDNGRDAMATAKGKSSPSTSSRSKAPANKAPANKASLKAKARAKGAARGRVGTPKLSTKPKAGAGTRPKSKSRSKSR
jgi:hypothetical protein